MPMGDDGDEVIGWWSPDPRGVLELDELHVSRSLARACRRHRVTIDHAFDEVIAACADEPRPGGWISPAISSAYRELHRLGWAHSIEAWLDDRLVGGIYGVQIGGLFAGESMFHRSTDASKVALVGLVKALTQCRVNLFDVQWQTEHLATLGVVTMGRSDYLARLAVAVATAADSLSALARQKSVL
jgi:leucyl/phenylalanyl-tRNA--protein transferase